MDGWAQMEIPMDGVRNPQEGIGAWERNFETYSAAALYHGWQHESVRSFYYGNSFVGMARANPCEYSTYLLTYLLTPCNCNCCLLPLPAGGGTSFFN